jgi:general secretion pathway protein M
MLALLAILIVWLLVVRPLADSLDAAKRNHAEAVVALADAKARADSARQLTERPVARAELPVDAFLGRTAGEAGFANARILAQGPAHATIAIDAAMAPAFFAWVRRMEQSGLTVDMVRVRANGDRTLAVEAGFQARRN